MTVQNELHLLVDALDGAAAKRELHATIDCLTEEQAIETLARMREIARRCMAEWGFQT